MCTANSMHEYIAKDRQNICRTTLHTYRERYPTHPIGLQSSEADAKPWGLPVASTTTSKPPASAATAELSLASMRFRLGAAVEEPCISQRYVQAGLVLAACAWDATGAMGVGYFGGARSMLAIFLPQEFYQQQHTKSK